MVVNAARDNLFSFPSFVLHYDAIIRNISSDYSETKRRPAAHTRLSVASRALRIFANYHCARGDAFRRLLCLSFTRGHRGSFALSAEVDALQIARFVSGALRSVALHTRIEITLRSSSVNSIPKSSVKDSSRIMPLFSSHKAYDACDNVLQFLKFVTRGIPTISRRIK